MKKQESYEQYRSKVGELSVKIILEKFGNLELIKIKEKKNQANPDYEIRNKGALVAVCEVKSLVDSYYETADKVDIDNDAWADLMRKRDKNHRDKLKRHLGKAISQLSKTTKIPQIICFVSFDMTDYIDMGQVLQEHLDLYPKDKIPDIFILMKVHQNTIPSDFFEIKETIKIMFNSKRGEMFSSKYFNWEDVVKKIGILPLTFQLNSSELIH